MSKKIDYLIMDVDGTLTDGKIYMGADGELFKAFDIKDGYCISTILPANKIKPVILTGRISKIVEKRSAELKVDMVYQGVADKREKISEIIPNLDSVAYIGDDLNDIPAMTFIKEKGGLVGCPQNAVKEVKAVVDYICDRCSGDGAVREFAEWIINYYEKQ